MDQALSLRRTRAQSAVDWRMFLRALAEEIDSLAGSGERDDMLRGVGRRMARLHPLPAVHALDALEMEANDVLDGLDELLAATDAELETVEGGGEIRAKDIREGLRRLQEINLVDRYLQT